MPLIPALIGEMWNQAGPLLTHNRWLICSYHKVINAERPQFSVLLKIFAVLIDLVIPTLDKNTVKFISAERIFLLVLFF